MTVLQLKEERFLSFFLTSRQMGLSLMHHLNSRIIEKIHCLFG